MIEVLQFLFSNFWVWVGFNITICITGQALAAPFYWWYKNKQFMTSKKQLWDKLGN